MASTTNPLELTYYRVVYRRSPGDPPKADVTVAQATAGADLDAVAAEFGWSVCYYPDVIPVMIEVRHRRREAPAVYASLQAACFEVVETYTERSAWLPAVGDPEDPEPTPRVSTILSGSER